MPPPTAARPPARAFLFPLGDVAPRPPRPRSAARPLHPPTAPGGQRVFKFQTGRPRKTAPSRRARVRWARAAALGSGLIVLAYGGFVTPAFPFEDRVPGIPPLSALARTNPSATRMMRLREDQAAALKKSYRVRQDWAPLSRISPALVNAVIAAEDSTFYRHHGVEWGLTRDALRESLATGRRDRGASTITQQVVRNLYLSPRKTYFRKFREIVLAQRMERFLPKDRILEIYLNVAEWGDGVFGAEAAARAHFGKSARDLTWEEAMALTAVLPSPLRHRPTDPGRWVQSRKDWVLQRLITTRRYVPPADPAPDPEADPV